MTLRAILGLALLASISSACGGGGDDGGGGPPTGVADFRHFTTIENISGSASAIDHPYANGNPDAQVFVTHNWNPSGTTGTYHDHPIAVSYASATGLWYILNIGAPMDPGLYFNVTIVSGSAAAWTHQTTAGNVISNWTILNHPTLNGAPGSLALAIKNIPDTGGPVAVSAREIATWYDGSAWTLLLQEAASSMDTDRSFHVHALPADGSSFNHQATVANITGNYTAFSHPDVDGNPNAHIQVTQRHEGGAYNDKAIGVWYRASTGLWNVYNEDESDMPVDAAFVVRVK